MVSTKDRRTGGSNFLEDGLFSVSGSDGRVGPDIYQSIIFPLFPLSGRKQRAKGMVDYIHSYDWQRFSQSNANIHSGIKKCGSCVRCEKLMSRIFFQLATVFASSTFLAL